MTGMTKLVLKNWTGVLTEPTRSHCVVTFRSSLSKSIEYKKLSYCWETVRRESMPRIAEMDVEMTRRKLAELPIHCQRQKCSPGNVVSGSIGFMQIFAGVRWRAHAV